LVLFKQLYGLGTPVDDRNVPVYALSVGKDVSRVHSCTSSCAQARGTQPLASFTHPRLVVALTATSDMSQVPAWTYRHHSCKSKVLNGSRGSSIACAPCLRSSLRSILPVLQNRRVRPASEMLRGVSYMAGLCMSQSKCQQSRRCPAPLPPASPVPPAPPQAPVWYRT
jgi:hypothetical protein